jgi:imidazolonepropionase-like amidohydrolase
MIPLFLHNPLALRGYTCLVPTLSAFFIPDLEHKLKPTEANHVIIENTKIIGESIKAGFITALKNAIPIGVGNDASVPRVTHYDLYKELLYMQKFSNLTNQALIHMATAGNAQILDVAQITGSLEVGKSADFMVLDHNPLEDLHHLYKPRHVVARGNFIKKPKFKVYKKV